MNNQIETCFAELVDFIRAQIGEYEKPIIRETLFEDDLGVTGDDAEDLLVSFSQRYNVEIKDFEFTKYFHDEPGIFELQNQFVKPFTVGHLEKAIIVGRLDEEVINS